MTDPGPEQPCCANTHGLPVPCNHNMTDAIADELHRLKLGCRLDYRGDTDCGGGQYLCHTTPAEALVSVFRRVDRMDDFEPQWTCHDGHGVDTDIIWLAELVKAQALSERNALAREYVGYNDRGWMQPGLDRARDKVARCERVLDALT